MEYKLITVDRYDDVMQHLRDNFFADEPLNKSVHLCQRGEGHIDLELHCFETLKDNLSLMALSETNEIAGVILNSVLRSGDLELAQEKLMKNTDENFKKIFQFLYSLNIEANIFHRFHIDKLFDLRVLSVDSRYRGRGIAKILIERSERLARHKGFLLMKGDATGIFSQKILKSQGFRVLIEQYYDKYRDEMEQPIFQVESPHIKLQVYYKLLN